MIADEATLARLMAKAQAGDRTAYNVLLSEAGLWLERYFRRRVPPHHLDDLVQDVLLALHADRIPEAFRLIFAGAFSGTAATGGFVGAVVAHAVREGVSRGIFSNESGLGSAGIAAAAVTALHASDLI